MKLSDRLFEATRGLWEESTAKPFVREMADGSLDEGKFRYYMIQDYFYLQDYIYILELTRDQAEKPYLIDFLNHIIESTKGEMNLVHIPNMKKLGITEDEIHSCNKAPDNLRYVEYLRKMLEEEGVMSGLTALLHCSWLYAYIAEVMMSRYSEKIRKSPYRSWFEAYSGRDYIESNQMWICVLDSEAEGIGESETEKLCHVFKICAAHENRFWDMVYDLQPTYL